MSGRENELAYRLSLEERTTLRTANSVWFRAGLGVLLTALLGSLPAAGNTLAQAIPQHLVDCLEAEPVVDLDALPPITTIDGGDDLLLRKRPFAYTPAVARSERGTVIAGASGDGETRDIVIAGLDDRGRVSFAHVIGGSGDDVATAIAVTPDGTYLVSGTTQSTDLIPDGRPRPGPKSFVLRIDGETLKVKDGTYFEATGGISVQDVATSREGKILFGGTATERITPSDSRETVTTVFPTMPSAAAQTHRTRTYVAGTLDDSLQPEIHLVFEAVAVDDVQVWYDCFGNPIIGVPPVSANACPGADELVYEMSQFADDYDIDHDWDNPPPGVGYPPGGMGFHALRWKFYRANATLDPGESPFIADWTLAPPDGDFNAIPKFGVYCDQAGELNTLEGMVFLQDGVPTNPSGSWVCDTHDNGQVLALRAAYYATRWGSPTYAVLGDDDSSHIEVAIEQTTFLPVCVPGGEYNGETLEDLCDFTVNTVDELTCAAGDQGVATPEFYIRAQRFSTSKWKTLVWYQRPSIFSHEEPQVAFASGEHLFDPPPNDPHGLDVIRAATDRMLPVMVDEVDLIVATYQGGILIRRQAARGLVTLASLR